MRTKIGRLEEAFNGHFDDHHAFLLARMLARIDGIDADIAAVDDQIEAQLAPFAAAAARLDEIPGIGPVAAARHHRRDRGGHVPLPDRRAPVLLGQVRPRHQLLGRARPRATAPPGTATATWPASSARPPSWPGSTDTFLGERYRRIARRRGKKRAIVAVGRSILVIIWHLLADPDARYHDLGADHYTSHINPDTKKRNHIRQLEALGYTVTLTPAA